MQAARSMNIVRVIWVDMYGGHPGLPVGRHGQVTGASRRASCSTHANGNQAGFITITLPFGPFFAGAAAGSTVAAGAGA